MSGDDDEVKDRETKQEYNLLCDWIKQQLGEKVAKVQVSKRLSSSPCVLVSGKFGWSANMERLEMDLNNTNLTPIPPNLTKAQSLFSWTYFKSFILLKVDESTNPWGSI